MTTGTTDERLTALETDMGQMKEKWKVVQQAPLTNARLLNSLRDTQLEHGRDIRALLFGYGAIEQRVGSLESTVDVLKHDVAALRDDVGVLKHDVAALKDDVSVLKGDVAGLREGQQTVLELVTRLVERDAR